MLEALNAYEKDLLLEYHCSLLNVLNHLKQPLMQNLENSISRDFCSESYILSLTMETIKALKFYLHLATTCTLYLKLCCISVLAFGYK